jgi:hypothetical protein
MNLEKRVAFAMVRLLRPAASNGEDFTSIDVDDSSVDFEELARAAISEISKTGTACGVCGCAIYPVLPVAAVNPS